MVYPHLRFLNFILLPHLRHENSVRKPIRTLSLGFVFTTLELCSFVQWSILKLHLQYQWCQFLQTSTFWERAALHSSHLTNKADVTSQFFLIFQVYIYVYMQDILYTFYFVISDCSKCCNTYVLFSFQVYQMKNGPKEWDLQNVLCRETLILVYFSSFFSHVR